MLLWQLWCLIIGLNPNLYLILLDQDIFSFRLIAN